MERFFFSTETLAFLFPSVGHSPAIFFGNSWWIFYRIFEHKRSKIGRKYLGTMKDERCLPEYAWNRSIDERCLPESARNRSIREPFLIPELWKPLTLTLCVLYQRYIWIPQYLQFVKRIFFFIINLWREFATIFIYYFSQPQITLKILAPNTALVFKPITCHSQKWTQGNPFGCSILIRYGCIDNKSTFFFLSLNNKIQKWNSPTQQCGFGQQRAVPWIAAT